MTVRAGTPVLVLTLTLLILTGIQTPIVHKVEGVAQAGPLTWSPFGPRTRDLAMKVYGDFVTTYDAFLNGEIDIADWPIEASDVVPFQNNPDFFVTDAQQNSQTYELDINHHNSFLGVPLQEPRTSDSFDSPSTRQPTQAGIQIRRALAHMLDKPDFENCAQCTFAAENVDIQSPPAQGLIGNGVSGNSKLDAGVLAEDCAAHPWYTPCNANNPPVSAYNLTPDSIGGLEFIGGTSYYVSNHGYSGTNDLRAACDHLVAAGFTITPSTPDCADVASRVGGAHLVPVGQVDFYIRSHPPRRAFGQIIKDTVDFLFGTPCTVRYGTACAIYFFTITEVNDVVFRTEPVRDDWHLYTGGWFLGSSANHLYGLYDSTFASSACGGKKSTFAVNYQFYCSPEFDQEAEAGQFASSPSEAVLHFAKAAVVGHRDVMTVPVYSPLGERFVALNGWNFQPGTESSLVTQFGYGFQAGAGFWSLLNMRQKPGYVPFDLRYTPGGGNPDLIRRSLTHQVVRLSLFHALTIFDFEVLSQIYDSMLQVNPLTGGGGLQVVDWMTVRHTSSFDPNEVFAGTTGVTTQTWTLRSDLRWHDGVPVTAEDVAFSLIKYRDIPSGILAPSVASVLAATAQNFKTLQVKLGGQSSFFETNIGLLPIIPKHVWAPLGDTVMADPNFDPMASGKMIGNGPWICKNLTTGAAGGSCTIDAGGNPSGQFVDIGGKVVLTAYDGYHRGRPGVAESSLHKFSWADRNNDAKVDILDVADVAIRFGMTDPYWNSAQNPAAPSVGTDASRVDIGELATVAFYFGHGLVAPLTPSTVSGLDPDIDPFF